MVVVKPTTWLAIERHLRRDDKHIDTAMVRRIKSLELSQTKDRAELRKLKLLAEKRRQTIKKLRAEIRKKTRTTVKTMLKKPAAK